MSFQTKSRRWEQMAQGTKMSVLDCDSMDEFELSELDAESVYIGLPE